MFAPSHNGWVKACPIENWELSCLLGSGQVALRVCVCVLGTIGSGWLLALAIVDVRRGDFGG
jgi:hypothetical protein